MNKWSSTYDCCQECGTIERKHRSRGFCTSCYYKVIRRKDPEKHRAYQRNYKRGEKYKAWEKEYNQKPEVKKRSRESSRRFKERHPERVKEIQQKWRDANRDKIKAYNDRPDIKLRNRRTILLRKYGPNSILALDRDNNECQKCGEIDPQVHHIDWNHEHDSLDNMVILCNSCHKSLHAWTPPRLRRAVFVEWMETQ